MPHRDCHALAPALRSGFQLTAMTTSFVIARHSGAEAISSPFVIARSASDEAISPPFVIARSSLRNPDFLITTTNPLPFGRGLVTST